MLTTGSRLGPYEIQSPIGAGGMGEVYRARDTRLDRMVAIKVLSPSLCGDPDFRERFDREGRTISALDHPHICTLYDVGVHDGTSYLVMQYLQGETLADRLATGELPIAQALEYAIQIADALDRAHSAGIVHRDLKPGNIMLTTSGTKLLDFGLAKASSRIAAASGLSMLPTTPPGLTAQGAILGTFHYMAPEQLEGRDADARTDIFAFGALLYEMIAGRRAFDGDSQAGLIGSILHVEPPALTTVQPLTPSSLDRLVQKCLRKDPNRRWQTARDLCDELQWVAHERATVPQVEAPARYAWREPAAWIVAALSAAAALFIVVRPAPAPEARSVVRLSILPPENTTFTGPSFATVAVPQLALSPDGREILFVAARPGTKPTLWLRSFDALSSSPLPGTEGADFPFWSPDGRWIGYFADGKLKKMPAGGGPSQAVADVADPRPGAWGPDDTILFSGGFTGILRIASSGGAVTPVTTLDAARQEGSHRFPQWLPDGAHILFSIRSSLTEQTGVYVGSLDGKTKKLLLRGNTNALYTPSGYLFFLDGDTLMAQAFDAERLELKGQTLVVDQDVGRSSLGTGAYTAATGTIAHTPALSNTGQLTWFNRDGNPTGSVGREGDYTDFRLSSDGTRLAASLVNPKTGFPDIWITDLARGNPAPFTFGPAVNASPAWAASGTRIIFRTTRNSGLTDIYLKSAGGGGTEEPVVSQAMFQASRTRSANVVLWDWSADESYLLFSAITSSDYDLWLAPLTPQAKPAVFLAAPGDQWHANFSPDGKLVAYSSNESGRFEVHVVTFPLSDRQWTVSTNGGYEPRWRADGREMYYLSLDQKLMSVDVGPGPSFGTPKALFQTRAAAGVSSQRTHYVASSDGQRFLVQTLSSEPAPIPITVVLNWAADVKK